VDANKALLMFQKLEISILGIIENMSTHICSKCGNPDPIFGTGGAEALSKAHDVPLLGQLPLDARIRENADNGIPSVVCDPKSDIATQYREVAMQMIASLMKQPRDYSIAAMVT
jgi:ATP-binding protein involved in chromosome partitioning